MRGLATATNGQCAFIKNTAEIASKVAELLERALQPCYTQVTVDSSALEAWLQGVDERAPSPAPAAPVSQVLVIFCFDFSYNELYFTIFPR